MTGRLPPFRSRTGAGLSTVTHRTPSRDDRRCRPGTQEHSAHRRCAYRISRQHTVDHPGMRIDLLWRSPDRKSACFSVSAVRRFITRTTCPSAYRSLVCIAKSAFARRRLWSQLSAQLSERVRVHTTESHHGSGPRHRDATPISLALSTPSVHTSPAIQHCAGARNLPTLNSSRVRRLLSKELATP
jgi:hypothetical protein